MPAIHRILLFFAVATALIAAVLAVWPIAQLPLPFRSDAVHCYDSVTTLSAAQPRAHCFSVSSDGRFSRVFQGSGEAGWESNARRSRGAVIPGIWDGHGHVLGLGEALNSVSLNGATSLKDATDRVKAYLEADPTSGTAGNWLRGQGWDQAAFGRMPTAKDLRAVEALNGKYIMLSRVDGHCIWVSDAVLNMLPNPIPEVPGGEVIRDPGLGVFCDNAMDLVMAHWPKPDDAKNKQYLKSAIKELNKVGLVGVHDASVPLGTIRLYDQLADSDDWTIRLYGMLECDIRNTFCPDEAKQIAREDGRLYIRSVKLFADGALGSWGSAMIDPYTDHPRSSGSLLVNGTTLTWLARSWAAAGYQVNIHAIGDRANRLAIDALSAALAALCPASLAAAACQARQHRLRIEHAQIMHPDDQARLHALGIVPSVQPTHATSDMAFAHARLGPDRLAREAYRLRSYAPLGLVLGSDFPVEPPNPFHGMYAAVARRSPRTGKGPPGGVDQGFLVEEALNMSTALAGFTTGPAWGAFLEGKAGVIQEGAFADWVVIERPFEELEVEDLLTLKVLETWVGGRRVYQA